jgi:hypothetical protein
MFFDVSVTLSEDRNMQFPKRRVELCVVKMENVVINITGRTNTKQLSKLYDSARSVVCLVRTFCKKCDPCLA